MFHAINRDTGGGGVWNPMKAKNVIALENSSSRYLIVAREPKHREVRTLMSTASIQ